MPEFSVHLAQVIEFIGETPNSFSRKLGYKRSQTIYDLLKNKVKPSYDFFNRFLSTEYSDKINIEWLISEKGKMLKNVSELHYLNEPSLETGKLPPGPCQQCKLRDEIIVSQKKTIETLEQLLQKIKK